MRMPIGWIVPGVILALIFAGVMWDWVITGRIVLGVILSVILAGSVLFAYICFRVRAYKWGAGCVSVAVLALLGLWWDIFLL